MEDLKKKDQEIMFSKVIKAGKRIYYIDVKKNRKEDIFVAITESKKIVKGDVNDPQIEFEKHKVFLYMEDFKKFVDGMNEAVQFFNQQVGEESPYYVDKNIGDLDAAFDVDLDELN